jgi:hypothetical protein
VIGEAAAVIGGGGIEHQGASDEEKGADLAPI